jgi:hypothetical protein
MKKKHAYCAPSVPSGLCLECERERLTEELRLSNLKLNEAKTLISDWLQHECSMGGPSWEEIESRARAFVADQKCFCGPEGMCDYHAVTAVDRPVQKERLIPCPRCGFFHGPDCANPARR